MSSADSQITDRLKKVDLNTITPIEAMNLLYELINLL
jgi:DNA mismatch repair ATPase MutS